MEIKKKLAFSVDEFKGRYNRICAEMAKRGMDALVVHTPENICYVSGFHTPGYYYTQVLVLVPGRDPVIILRALEGRGVDAHSWLGGENRVTYSDNDDPIATVAQAIKDLGLARKTVGIEMFGWYLPIARYRQLETLLPDIRFVDGSWIVEGERKIKSPAEIDCIRRACKIADMGMQTAVDTCRAGITENALSGEIHKTLVTHGGEYTGLPVLIASGHRALVSHAVSSDKVIERGDCIYVEFAGTVNRYAGPLFRTLVVGAPSPSVAKNARTAELMLDAAMKALKPGATSQEVSHAVAEAASGGGAKVFKRAGYSVGLNFAPDWGEGFFLELKDGDPTVIEPGMVFHLPQSVRVPGEAPVALSETVLVTDTGIEVLTNFRRSLLQV